MFTESFLARATRVLSSLSHERRRRPHPPRPKLPASSRIHHALKRSNFPWRFASSRRFRREEGCRRAAARVRKGARRWRTDVCKGVESSFVPAFVAACLHQSTVKPLPAQVQRKLSEKQIPNPDASHGWPERDTSQTYL
jgi:hypothetical protein